MKRFLLLKYAYYGLNWLDTKFFKKNHPEYQSNFAKKILFITFFPSGFRCWRGHCAFSLII